MTNDKQTNCTFCKIVAGDVPAEKIYEDEHFLAFLDINPQAPGHAQVIPKEHYRWVWDLPAEKDTLENAGDYFRVAQKIAKAQQKAFSTEWILSKIVGDEVPHAHIWVFPGDAKGGKQDIAENAEKIRQALE
ncbi:MAG: HIT domain-containing protein [Candidatus Paceibacterota bacterium]